MLTAEQCKTYAAEYQRLGQEADISPQRAALLMNICRSWTALANQLDRLATLIKEESKQGRLTAVLITVNVAGGLI